MTSLRILSLAVNEGAVVTDPCCSQKPMIEFSKVFNECSCKACTPPFEVQFTHPSCLIIDNGSTFNSIWNWETPWKRILRDKYNKVNKTVACNTDCIMPGFEKNLQSSTIKEREDLFNNTVAVKWGNIGIQPLRFVISSSQPWSVLQQTVNIQPDIHVCCHI